MARKHGFTHVNIEHHGDRSHTVHHVHGDGSGKDVKHAAADLDAVHDSMQENLNPAAPAASAAAPATGAAMPSQAPMPGPVGV
jgi:hypothetical protein